MARVLFCWEIGIGSGHLGTMLPVARALRDRGHDVVFALRDLSNAERMLGPHDLHYVQAPVWTLGVANLPPARNYAATLAMAGWGDEMGLTALLNAWRRLYGWLAPDLILLDHSPTAMLAASGLGIPRAELGNGYFCPPRAAPFPALQWWQPPPLAELQAFEGHVLEQANRALRRAGMEPLGDLAALFQCEERFLICFPETDHYPGRAPPDRHWGHLPTHSGGARPVWPAMNGPRIFAYLHPHYEDIAKLLDAIKATGMPALVHMPGLSESAARDLGSSTMFVSRAPLAMNEVVAQARLIIAHSGIGTGLNGLLAGIPCLLLPLQIENLMIAQRYFQQGLGLFPSLLEGPADYRKLISRLLDDRSFTANAASFAARYPTTALADNVERIASRCEELMAR